MEELRKKICFWHNPGRFRNMSEVRLEPNGKPYEVHEGSEGLYVIDDDGERTYLIYG
jgi:hypothetical protein